MAVLPDEALATVGDIGRFVAEDWRMRQDGGKFWVMQVLGDGGHRRHRP